MVKRRKGPPARSSAVRRNPEEAQRVVESRLPETLSEPEIAPESAEASALCTEAHVPSVHDALLETVSADALEAAAGQPVSDRPAEAEPAEAAVPAEPADDATEPAAVMQPPEALEAAPDTVTIPDVAPETAPAVATLPVAVMETASVAQAVAMAQPALTRPTEASFDMIGEITQANATILAFLRSEGSAAMAHWHSLSGARTPADAIRIQVDEMQRAADASLTCFSVLARRAGRLAAGIGRV